MAFFLRLAERELSVKVFFFPTAEKALPCFLVVFVADVKLLKTKCTFFHQYGFELFRLKQTRAVCRQMEEGSQCLGTFQLWDGAYQFSKSLLAPVSARGSSLAPNNPRRVPGLAVLFGC